MTVERRALLSMPLCMWASSALSQVGPSGRPLRFGLITPRQAERVVAAWTPLLQRLGSRIHQPVVATAMVDTSSLVSAFASGSVDLAWAGNAAALAVVEAGHGEVFAQMKSVDGRVAYQSVLLVHRSSRLSVIDDVHAQAARLVYGDGEPASTSGHLVPLYYAFVRRGFGEPKALFKEVRAANHRTNMLRLARGELDVATSNDVELELLRHDDPRAAANLRVIWRSPPIPQSPLLWRANLPAATRRSVLQAVLQLGQDDATERALLQQANELGGFVRSSNRQLITVADLEMFARLREIDNDASIGATRRASSIATITDRASRLEVLLKRPTDLPGAP
jgi:phosphonate transport system substrate-binding protein